VLALYIGEGSVQFSQEIRKIDWGDVRIGGPADISVKSDSLLLDEEVLKNLVKNVLAIEVETSTPLYIKQAQVQILKAMTTLIEAEIA